MALLKKSTVCDERGFAFIAALLAMLILISLGVLIFTLTTRDVRVAVRLVGEKKAFTAAENGIHWVLQNWDPANPANLMLNAPACPGLGGYNQVPNEVDATTCFTLLQAPSSATSGPSSVNMSGNSVLGSQPFTMVPFDVKLIGTSTDYMSQFAVDFQLAYGPVNPTTIY